MTNEDISNQNLGLEVGTEAPPIDIEDIYGKRIVLKDLTQKWNVLFIEFFRGAF